MKVWQSYLENKTSGAMRMYWVYGPDQKDITIIGLEPHSEDKKMVHTTEFHCQICRIKLNMEVNYSVTKLPEHLKSGGIPPFFRVRP